MKNPIFFILTTSLTLRKDVCSLTISSRPNALSMSLKPRGCGSKPFEKQSVAVFGTGGYMGATIFGFIQRASSIYGTGLGGISSPRSICATPSASAALNKVLLRTFKLAFAGEDMVRLTNMQEVDSISQRLKGMDAAVLGTVYQMEQKAVALNTYEKTPNDKTYEFYLDDQYAANWDVPANDMETHLEIFKNSVDACKAAELKHIVVIETPNTKESKSFAKILDEAGIPFTYISSNGKLETTKIYTFEEGIQTELAIDGYTLAANYQGKKGYKAGDWSDSVEVKEKCEETIAREDIAALAVQSLISLDWETSRYLSVSPLKSLAKMTLKEKSKLKSDKSWCINSDVIAANLQTVL